ncbi:hypothetical protein LCGC14_1927590 [marine sediment metagenome]|uniref:Uncharacterized protein n=1 Tax=marine sediment metagenome TaxID=412755 RepID=A0A0F9ILQ1_9ZZZZ
MTEEQEKKKQVIPSIDELLSSSEPLQSLDIDAGDGKGFTITYRAMSWLDKSACVAKATEFYLNDDGKPQTMFHVEIYFREALKKLLVTFPYPISDKILNGLKPLIGEQLQTIIPAALGESPTNLAGESEKPSTTRKRKTRSRSDTL